MSMATGIEQLEDTVQLHSSDMTMKPIPAATTQPIPISQSAIQDSSIEAGAVVTSEGDDDRSIHFVNVEPDMSPSAVTAVSSTATVPPYEGDGEDPTQAPPFIRTRSTFDWLAYTVSLNYNRLATSVFSPITQWRWYNPVPHTNIILGAVPSQRLVRQLSQEYAVKNIVNMCAEFRGHLQTMKELDIVQCWLPTQDFQTPSIRHLWAGVKFIEKCEKQCQERSKGQKGTIYIHCKAGRGRSATMVLCWLVYCYKLTSLDAQAIMLKARGQVDKNVYQHPEVVSFYEQVLDQEANGTLERKAWPVDIHHNDHSNNTGNNLNGDTEDVGGSTGGDTREDA
ncbi:hypothetical protein FBU30_008411 [Linnemannia zychae]|nr:hypothetical protein FBU30_008411 [Linnemannia zychae]